ncbi:MAG: NRDE family protein [Rhodospirillales bacterium]|jgi:hypothetical protein|nr:NRDE family protein [Rhodospirillales bacterium]MDP6773104.1 NRDE family protein [Rhodospirillales bacterium]
MCTVVILRRPGHDWPLLLAANRDEMRDRPWAPPARHWPERDQVVAGIDLEASGTWLGLNDDGLVAAVLNRPQSLGPAAGYRSRGELPLEALDHADADAAARALADIDPAAYRTFNMVVADGRDAFWLRSAGGEEGAAEEAGVEVMALPEGLSMITAHDRNDPSDPRIRDTLPRFRAAPAPDPGAGDWASWESLLASREHGPGDGPGDAMNVVTDTGFGTVSSSLIALPAPARVGAGPLWLFAPGRPDEAGFEAVLP